jgi:ABC-2 type transport system permease protein
VIVLAVANAMLGMALGLFVSAFANSEFQAVQFMPAFLMPQFLLAGLIIQRDRMARALEVASDFLPLTYAFDAPAQVTVSGNLAARLWLDVAVIAGCIAVALALGATTLRRRTP